VAYADQTGHTAHWNKLSRRWTKKVELDREPQDPSPEKASCSEQQCYRLFDTQGLDKCIEWIHCGSPESDRIVRERRPPIVWTDAFNHKRQIRETLATNGLYRVGAARRRSRRHSHGGTDESQHWGGPGTRPPSAGKPLDTPWIVCPSGVHHSRLAAA
jgi:hypothetical protein